MCSACTLLFVHPRPEPAGLDDLYETSWSAPGENQTETGATTSSMANTFVARLESSLSGLALPSLAGQAVIEFGAGTGAMAEALHRAGAEVWAVEPYGFESLADRGFQCVRHIEDLPHGKMFDGVVTLDVVEHLIEPWEDLRAIRRRLRPGGWAFVSTPNSRGLNARLTGANWRELKNPGHITMFSPASLAAVLKSAGFDKVHRLHWFIDYGASYPYALVHHAIQAMRLDGALRMLAISAGTEPGR